MEPGVKFIAAQGTEPLRDLLFCRAAGPAKHLVVAPVLTCCTTSRLRLSPDAPEPM